MRCPSCEKFVPYCMEDEPEEADDPMFEEGTFRASYRLVLACEECGEELKDVTFDLEQTTFDWTMPGEDGSRRGATPEEVEHCNHPNGDGEHEFTLDEVAAFNTEERQTVNVRGKPIKNLRNAKIMYKTEVTGEIICLRCDLRSNIKASDSASASSMDELV